MGMLDLNPFLTTYERMASRSVFVPGRSELPLQRRTDGCADGCLRARTDCTRLPWDSGGKYGGWGGHVAHQTDAGVSRPPVIFVHGNYRDACDWVQHAADLKERGYTGDELWAITFREPTPRHDDMVAELEAFVSRVLSYTGADEVSLVAHSLGVTGVRYWMEECDRYDSVSTVVGLAGANHGIVNATVCDQLGLSFGKYRVCGWLRDDYEDIEGHPLAKLNSGTETPGNVEYYTIRGTRDSFFRECKDSPRLEGAEENVVLDVDHDGVRESAEARRKVYEWLP